MGPMVMSQSDGLSHSNKLQQASHQGSLNLRAGWGSIKTGIAILVKVSSLK